MSQPEPGERLHKGLKSEQDVAMNPGAKVTAGLNSSGDG